MFPKIIIILKGERKMVNLGGPKIVVYKQVGEGGLNKQFGPVFINHTLGYFSLLYFD